MQENVGMEFIGYIFKFHHCGEVLYEQTLNSKVIHRNLINVVLSVTTPHISVSNNHDHLFRYDILPKEQQQE